MTTHQVDASCDAASDCDLSTVLASLFTADGVPVSINIASGSYNLSSARRRLAGAPTAPVVDFAGVTASEVWISGDRGVVLQVDGATPLFRLTEGGPRLTLSNLTIRGQVIVDGGNLVIESCVFEGINVGDGDGAALRVSAGSVRASVTDFMDNMARRGGAVHVSDGTVDFRTCRFTRNFATDADGGGAIFVQKGFVTFRDECLLRENTAAGKTQAAQVESGEVRYHLPAPRGFWVETTAGNSYAQLAAGATIDMPYSCLAGFKGSSPDQMRTQNNPLCGGRCDPGFYCDDPMTPPKICETGAFCGPGSPVPRSCPEGTFRSEPGGTSRESCNLTYPGFFSPPGATAPTRCFGGTFTQLYGQATCTSCDLGLYQRERGATQCRSCDPGSFCGTAGLTAPTLCSAGESLGGVHTLLAMPLPAPLPTPSDQPCFALRPQVPLATERG